MFRTLWVYLMGKPDEVERKISENKGVVVKDPKAAQQRLIKAETTFMVAVKGVVEENERLKKGRGAWLGD